MHDENAYKACTLRVSCLSFEATEADVKKHFLQLVEEATRKEAKGGGGAFMADADRDRDRDGDGDGESSTINAVQLLLAYSGRSRGIALVTFATFQLAQLVMGREKTADKVSSNSSADNALSCILGRPYRVEHLPPDADIDEVRSGPLATTVYCGKIPPTWGIADVENMFNNAPGNGCGAIVASRLIKKSAGTGTGTGTGTSGADATDSNATDTNASTIKYAAMVQFATEEGRRKAMKLFKHHTVVVQGNPDTSYVVEVSLSKFPVVQRQHSQANGAAGAVGAQASVSSSLEPGGRSAGPTATATAVTATATATAKKAAIQGRSALSFRPRAMKLAI